MAINETHNLGLIKAIHVGVTPPENKNLIWFDNNTGQKKHKVYNFTALEWQPVFSKKLVHEASVDPVNIPQSGHQLTEIHSVSIYEKTGNVLSVRYNDYTIDSVSLDISINNSALEDLYIILSGI